MQIFFVSKTKKLAVFFVTGEFGNTFSIDYIGFVDGGFQRTHKGICYDGILSLYQLGHDYYPIIYFSLDIFYFCFYLMGPTTLICTLQSNTILCGCKRKIIEIILKRRQLFLYFTACLFRFGNQSQVLIYILNCLLKVCFYFIVTVTFYDLNRNTKNV